MSRYCGLIVLVLFGCGSETTPEGGDRDNGSATRPNDGGQQTSDDDDDDAPGAVAGNGVCETDEDAQSAPQDCPTVAGDGLCTGTETPATTPADCPSVLGDGLCTAGETFLNAESDCPPPDLVVNRTTRIAELRAVSPNLRFGTLDIQQTLYIDKEALVTLRANVFSLSGTISTEDVGSCDQRESPSIAIIAPTVTITGHIWVNGAVGEVTYPQTPQCSCYGNDAGDVTITATSLAFTGNIHADGGFGSSINHSATNRVGCNGGRGGKVIFDAQTIAPASGFVEVNGGLGGISFQSVGSTYATSRIAAVYSGSFEATQDVTLAPLDQHASVQQAQVIGPRSVTTGVVKDGVQTGAYMVDYLATRNAKIDRKIITNPPYQDKIEQLYRVRNSGTSARSYTVRLSPTTSANVDLDLQVFNAANLQKLYEGFTESSVETGTFTLQPGAEAIIGVSAFFSNPERGFRLELR